jgi:hypothetical protein
MKLHILTSLLLATTTLSWAVPSKINYQGRLSDTFGEPLTGDVSITLKMFDASVAGEELYVEDIGNVSLDDNGFYSFQFGSGGQAVAQAEELIGTSDGSSTTYNGAITSTMLNASLVVADGTNSWNVVDGNPGVQATGSAIIASGFVVGINITNAGEAYVGPPTITIEGDGTGASASAVVENGSIAAIAINNPGSGYTSATVTFDQYPTPYVVTYSSVTGQIGVTYDTAPAVGTEIMATYETPDSSIVGALSASDSHWLELTIDGVVQSPRERILSVPFAQVSGSAEQAGGDLAEAIASLNSNPDLPVVTQRGYTKEGDDAITIPAGYRMRILSTGTDSAYSSDSSSYTGSLRLMKDGSTYGYLSYSDRYDSYLDGPIDVKAYSRNNTGWFSYEIKKISLGEQ